jgi:hypothetical protein
MSSIWNTPPEDRGSDKESRSTNRVISHKQAKGVWSNQRDELAPGGWMSLWRDFVEWRMERRRRQEEDLLRAALVGERPPNVQGALGLWGAFLTIEGVMALLTGVIMWGLFAPAFRWTDGGIQVLNRMSFAGLVVIGLSLVYMGCVAFGLMAIRAHKRRRAEHLRRLADQTIAAAADARTEYVFSEPEDEAEAELLHEHDRLALAGKPLTRNPRAGRSRAEDRPEL